MSSKDKIVEADSVGMLTVLAFWWLAALITVWVAVHRDPAASVLEPFLMSVQRAIPSVQKYAGATKYKAEVAAFYCFFLATSPFVAVLYLRFVVLLKPMSGSFKLIVWAVIPVVIFILTIGVDAAPTNIRGHISAFNAVLTSSWFGSSFLYLLFYHCFLSALVLIIKDGGKWQWRTKKQ